MIAGRFADSAPDSSQPLAIGLGSNVGDRAAHLRLGLSRLSEFMDSLRVSSVYETAPVHVEAQPDFLNLCCTGRTELDPATVLRRLKAIEREAGRSPGGPRYGPRELDLDILLYGDAKFRSEALAIPHPRLEERAFVLVPLAEIAPDWHVPGGPDTVGELADRVDAAGVRKHGRLAGLEPDAEVG